MRDRIERYRRTDVPPEHLPERVKSDTNAAPTGRFSTVIKTLGLIATVMAAVLAVLVIIAINKNRDVRDSGETVIDNFATTNLMFDTRADLSAPQRARAQLAELTGILTDLDKAAGRNANRVNAMLPDTRRLLASGGADVAIVHQLRDVTTTLASSSQQLGNIATTADGTVGEIDKTLGTAVDLVNALNAELKRTTDKLRPIPAQNELIPRDGEPK